MANATLARAAAKVGLTSLIVEVEGKSGLARELARAERLKSEVSLMVMDLDSFKDINDSHGHHVGDKALCEVARVLRTAIRPYDICVRYAGDEFIVVISDCPREAAELKRRELQARLSEIEFAVRPGRLARLAVSAGVAIFPHDGDALGDGGEHAVEFAVHDGQRFVSCATVRQVAANGDVPRVPLRSSVEGRHAHLDQLAFAFAVSAHEGAEPRLAGCQGVHGETVESVVVDRVDGIAQEPSSEISHCVFTRVTKRALPRRVDIEESCLGVAQFNGIR